MKEDEECQRVVLAQEGGFRVDYCSCGSIHVHAGSLTFRLEERAAESLAAVMARAMINNRERAKEESAPYLRLVPAGATATPGA